MKLGKNTKILSLDMKHGAFNMISKAKTKFQWNQSISPRSKNVLMSKSHMKKILIAFFYTKCTVYFEFIPQAQIVNEAYCMEVMKRLHEAVHRKSPELWPNDWSLHHDNAPAHKTHSDKQFLAQISIT
jgi:hypothetical protein